MPKGEEEKADGNEETLTREGRGDWWEKRLRWRKEETAAVAKGMELAEEGNWKIEVRGHLLEVGKKSGWLI